jgi:hypothetical protein
MPNCASLSLLRAMLYSLSISYWLIFFVLAIGVSDVDCPSAEGWAGFDEVALAADGLLVGVGHCFAWQVTRPPRLITSYLCRLLLHMSE